MPSDSLTRFLPELLKAKPPAVQSTVCKILHGRCMLRCKQCRRCGEGPRLDSLATAAAASIGHAHACEAAVPSRLCALRRMAKLVPKVAAPPAQSVQGLLPGSAVTFSGPQRRSCFLQAEEVLPELSAAMWASAPQRACHAIQAWGQLGLLPGSAIARWALQAPGFKALSNEQATMVVWEALLSAVQRAESSHQVLAIAACQLMHDLSGTGALVG